MSRVITYGTFDTFHYGHLELLYRIKQLGSHLTVAISTDEFNLIKGKTCIFPYDTRYKWIKCLGIVDRIIPETEWDQKVGDIVKYNIDLFVMGDDWRGKFDHLASDVCEITYLKRTEGISSTHIKEILNNSTTYEK
jgi:glycerol-3-phosphate cytidylyltransferase